MLFLWLPLPHNRITPEHVIYHHVASPILFFGFTLPSARHLFSKCFVFSKTFVSMLVRASFRSVLPSFRPSLLASFQVTAAGAGRIIDYTKDKLEEALPVPPSFLPSIFLPSSSFTFLVPFIFLPSSSFLYPPLLSFLHLPSCSFLHVPSPSFLPSFIFLFP